MNANTPTPPSARPDRLAMAGSVMLPVGAAAWFGAVFFAFQYTIDDTFIHLQFARNLAEGKGFRFWPGSPPVYGCTSPGWVALLALARLPAQALGAPAGAQDWGLSCARLLSAACGLAGLIAFYELSRKTIAGKGALLAPLLLAVNPWWVRWSASGMESAFAAAIVVVAWRMTAEDKRGLKRAVLLGALCGLGALMRPELALLAPVIVAMSGGRAEGSEPRRPSRSASALAALIPWFLIGAAWAMFAFFHFGSVFPTAISAKAGETGWLSSAGGGMKRLLEMALLSDAPLLAALVVWAVCAMLRKHERLDAPWRLAVAWPVTIILFLLAGRGPMQSRYLLVAWPCLTLLGARALLECAAALKEWLKTRAGARAAAACYAAIVAAPVIYSLGAGCAVVYPQMMTAARNLAVYRQMAEYIKDNTPPDAYVAAPEIGILGYYAQRRLLDLGGLISPEVNRRPTRGRKEELAVSLEFLRQAGATHYLDPHGKVRALQESGAQDGARFTELASWMFVGGTSLTDRKTYTQRLYRIEWKTEENVK